MHVPTRCTKLAEQETNVWGDQGMRMKKEENHTTSLYYTINIFYNNSDKCLLNIKE